MKNDKKKKRNSNAKKDISDLEDQNDYYKNGIVRKFTEGFKSGIFSKRGSFLMGISHLHEISQGIKEMFLNDLKDKNFSERAYE